MDTDCAWKKGDEPEHGCEFCYYELFDGKAYPCSMCVCGEKREDMFQPKIRPARKGKWIRDYKSIGLVWNCSVCRSLEFGDEEYLDKFCPNCGADMRGEDEN